MIPQNIYDGSSRRITKVITNSGYLDGSYEYYYSPEWQLLETRNGSGQVIKQQVWGMQYIDELVQIAINGDPVDDVDFDSEDPDHDFRGYPAPDSSRLVEDYLAKAQANIDLQLQWTGGGRPSTSMKRSRQGKSLV